MSNEKLTFGELCEAIVADRQVQRKFMCSAWEDFVLTPKDSLFDVWRFRKNSEFRIKPKCKYQWLVKTCGKKNRFTLTKDKYTAEDAEKTMKGMIEPYLPSEEPSE